MSLKIKKGLGLLLSLGLVLALCACGKSSLSGDKAAEGTAVPGMDPEFVYSAQFKELPPPQVSSLSPAAMTREGFYYIYMEKAGERPVPQGMSAEYEGQYDILEPRIAFCGFDGKLSKLEAYSPNLAQADGDKRDFQATTNIYKLLVDGEGRLVVLENVYRSWSEAPDNVKADDPEYYDSLVTDNSCYVQVLDGGSGAPLSSNMLELSDPDSLSPYSAQLDDKGNLLLPSQSGGLSAFSMEGKPVYNIEFNGYIYSMLTLKDGRAAVLLYDMDEPDYDKATALRVVNGDKGAFEPESYPMDSFELIPGGGDYDLYYTDKGYLCGYDLGAQEALPLFKWTGCDVDSNSVQLLRVEGDGVIRGLSRESGGEEGDERLEYFSISKVPCSAVPQKTVLSMAVMYLDYNTQSAVIKFNRSHDDVRIELMDYSEYNSEEDWSAGLTKLNTEIMAGNMPDIISLTEQIPYRQLAAKGLLEDLYPYIEADEGFDREDFFPNVLSALEVDGRLCAACSGFSVQTVAGAASVVGDKPGWTYEDYYAALATMPEGCEGFDLGTSRQSMLKTALALDMGSFVDWGAGTCNFDSDEFIKILEFAKQFPDKSVYEDHEFGAEDSTSTRISQGKQMLTTASFTGVDYILCDLDRMFGGSSTCIGYPTSKGVGNILTMGDSYAMSSSCRDKEAAWQFLRGFLTREHQEKGSNLPTNKKAFDSQLEKAMELKYQKDAKGNYILDENGERKPLAVGLFSDGVNVYEVYAVTPRQAQQLREVIASSTKMADSDRSITDIVTQQASAYFAGQKSAQDVARLIQSKVNIYINEQR